MALLNGLSSNRLRRYQKALLDACKENKVIKKNVLEFGCHYLDSGKDDEKDLRRVVFDRFAREFGGRLIELHVCKELVYDMDIMERIISNSVDYPHGYLDFYMFCGGYGELDLDEVMLNLVEPKYIWSKPVGESTGRLVRCIKGILEAEKKNLTLRGNIIHIHMRGEDMVWDTHVSGGAMIRDYVGDSETTIGSLYDKSVEILNTLDNIGIVAKDIYVVVGSEDGKVRGEVACRVHEDGEYTLTIY